jgi:AAA+ superfamily predicted ATPase
VPSLENKVNLALITTFSVFLRKVEYYQGILILTTNLVNTIDEAFRSRINIAIEFKELSYTTRLKIWTTFITGVDRSLIDHTRILAEVSDWANEPLNARQIRNVVLTAESLAIAKGEGGRIEPDDIQLVLKHTIKTELSKLGNSGKGEHFKGGW